MFAPPPQRSTSDRVVVLGVAGLVGLLVVGGLFFIWIAPRTCACPGQSPLGAYFALGTVQTSRSAGIYFTVVHPGAAVGTDLPLAPMLASLSFEATAPGGSPLSLLLVCVVSANGTLLGTSTGGVGGWSSQASSPAAQCPITAGPSGSLPPDSNRLTSGSTIVYDLSAPAPTGTLFWMTANAFPTATGWAGSVNQPLDNAATSGPVG
jgi:hypothetical protein